MRVYCPPGLNGFGDLGKVRRNQIVAAQSASDLMAYDLASLDARTGIARQPLEQFDNSIAALGVRGATQVRTVKKGKGGGVTRTILTPAAPVAPLNDDAVAAILAPPAVVAAPTPGFFQDVRADGTLGPSWVKIGLVGVGAVLLGFLVLRRR